MRVADWLTYTDINHLKRINQYYGCECNDHSKNELICSLLRQMSRKQYIQKMMDQLPEEELRFLQLIMLDSSTSYSMEELIAKGRAAMVSKEGDPRSYIASALKKGWLFPGYSNGTQHLYYIPEDTRERVVELLTESFIERAEDPTFYRDEEHLMVADLCSFLQYVSQDLVRLTSDGSIYKKQQKNILSRFYVLEDMLLARGPRFGFGRKYHLYPDRFSLLYDYAYYKEYIEELEEGILRVTDKGSRVMLKGEAAEGRDLYRFWIRLYRRPIPHLPLILRWIGLLGKSSWVSFDVLYQAVSPWLTAYYYEEEKSLFERVMKMLLHLGMVRLGVNDEQNIAMLTPTGVRWMQGVAAFQENVLEEGFVEEG